MPVRPDGEASSRNVCDPPRGRSPTGRMPFMNEWGLALVAAGSALAGGGITGWFARSAGVKQAEAARHAGERQADALLETVRATHEEHRVVRVLDIRRQTYLRFLESAETVILSQRTGTGSADDLPALQRAFAAVQLEGPGEVSRTAAELIAGLRRNDRPDDVERAKTNLIEAARAASHRP